MRFMFALLLAAGFSGCASAVLKKDEVKKVKTAAIIGWDLSVERPRDFKISLGAKDDSPGGMKGATVSVPKPSPLAGELYDKFQVKTEKSIGVRVMSRANLEKHPAYQRWYSEYTEGWQNRGFVPEQWDVYRPEKVLDTYSIRKMEPAQLEELRKALGVDALIVADIHTTLEKRATVMSLVGGGNLVPKASLSFSLFRNKINDAIWWEPQISFTDENTKIESFIGFADSSKTQSGSMNVARTVIDNAGNEFKQKLNQ